LKEKIDRKKASKKATSRMLQTGHCGQAALYIVSNLLSVDDFQKLTLSTSGFAEGIGCHGAVCGTLVGGALALSLVCANHDKSTDKFAEKGCLCVRNYARQFTHKFGSTLCEDITNTDFSDDWQVRKHAAIGSLQCIKLASQSAAMIADILNQKQGSLPDYFSELNREFSNNNFHCAYVVVQKVLESMEINSSIFPKQMLIPLNGGIGYCGSTCTALIGGCMVLGILRGGDNSQGGVSETIWRQTKVLIKGTAAYSNPNHSPANEALLLCSELISWFEEKYSSHLCHKITRVNFDDKRSSQEYFSNGTMPKCSSIAEETIKQVQKLVQ
jgi:C_GCAxxG_C_C family probable redox protein